MTDAIRPYYAPAKRAVMTWSVMYNYREVATITAKDKQDGGKAGKFPGAEQAFAEWCNANDANPMAYTIMLKHLG